MSVQMWMFLCFVFTSLTILGGFLDMQTASSPELSALNNILQFQVITNREFRVFFWDLQAPLPNLSFFSDLASLLTWRFRFFQGDLNLLRWLVWLPLTGAVMWGLITQVVPTIMSSISWIRGWR